MIVLIISKLSGNKWAGPSVCVPKIVQYQSKFDDVFWYNLNTVEIDSWKNNNYIFANLNTFPTSRLSDLPVPFNKPDIAVVEEVYTFPFSKLIKDLQTNNIPYVVVPHSQLTTMAQAQKKCKKRIANFLYFNSMIKKATAIQYLSIGEMNASIERWGNKGYIVPNGIEIKDESKLGTKNNNSIVASYIGRIDIYQKGLDLLIEAIKGMSDHLRSNNFVFNIYGPINDDYHKLQKCIVTYNLEDIIYLHDSVFEEEKHNILSNTDVFIMTSRFEGHSLGLIEALSYGLPCLVSDGTFMTAEVKDYDAGWTCNNNPKDIAFALSCMIDDRNRFNIMGSNAIRLAKTYSWDNIAYKNHCKYKELLEEQ